MEFKQMKIARILCVLIGGILVALPVQVDGDLSFRSTALAANNGKHGSSGYFEDGGDGENGKIGINGQNGGHN